MARSTATWVQPTDGHFGDSESPLRVFNTATWVQLTFGDDSTVKVDVARIEKLTGGYHDGATYEA